MAFSGHEVHRWLAKVGIQADASDVSDVLQSALNKCRSISSAQEAVEFCMAQRLVGMGCCLERAGLTGDVDELDSETQDQIVLNSTKPGFCPKGEAPMSGHWNAHMAAADFDALRAKVAFAARLPSTVRDAGLCSAEYAMAGQTDEPPLLAAVCGHLYASKVTYQSGLLNAYDIRKVFRSTAGAARFMADALPYLSESTLTERVDLPEVRRVAPDVSCFKGTPATEQLCKRSGRSGGHRITMYCFLWQSGPVVSKLWLSFIICVPRQSLLASFVQTAVQRVASWRADFVFDF